MTKAKKVTGKQASKPKRVRQPASAKTKNTTKLNKLEAMLPRPEGATIAQLVKALSWQAHSIRGALSGALKKKQGLEIAATRDEGQDRVYRIAG